MPRSTTWVRIVPVIAAFAVSSTAQETTQPLDTPPTRSPGKWLVDLARDYGHSVKGPPSLPDVQIALTLLRAAARLEPNLPEPYWWQAELLDDLNRPDEALAALERYVRLDPNDLTERLRWIGLKVNALQTVEARREFIEAQLIRDAANPLILSDAHRRLAEIALARADQNAARMHMEAALRLTPGDITANRLAPTILPGSDDPAAQVRRTLHLIAATPMQVDLVWTLGNLLDDLSLHREAQSWYAYALDVFRAAHPGTDPPSEYLLDLAESRADSGDLEAALKDCTESLRIDPAYVPARLLMADILRKLGRAEAAQEQIRTVADRYAKMADQVITSRDAHQAAEMAWFYAYYGPQPEQAIQFARITLASFPDHPIARRAHGFAALAKGNHAEAERVLKDLAPSDPMAAIGLARTYLATNRPRDAVPILQHAVRFRSTGFAHDEIARMLRDNGQSVPPPPDHADVRKILAEFDRAPLEYYKQPTKFLRLTARFLQPRMTLTDPWYVLFELSNLATFNITLGNEGMLRPLLLLSVETTGDQTRRFTHYMLVHLNRLGVLEPGKSVRLLQTIDIGPLRQIMTITPQVTHEISLSGLLDAVQFPDGRWGHHLGGFDAPLAKATRLAVHPSPQKMAELKADLASDQPDRVLNAATVLSSLLAEQEALRDGTLNYQAVPIDPTDLWREWTDAATRRGHDPIHRARLIESLRPAKLPDRAIQALAPFLSDDHWLVRLTTAWILAHKQGPTFAGVARRLTQNDPDPLVRDLTAAYLTKWASRHPTTR